MARVTFTDAPAANSGATIFAPRTSNAKARDPSSGTCQSGPTFSPPRNSRRSITSLSSYTDTSIPCFPRCSGRVGICMRTLSWFSPFSRQYCAKM